MFLDIKLKVVNINLKDANKQNQGTGKHTQKNLHVGHSQKSPQNLKKISS